MGNRNRMKKREKVLIFVNFLFGTRIHFSQIMKYKKMHQRKTAAADNGLRKSYF